MSYVRLGGMTAALREHYKAVRKRLCRRASARQCAGGCQGGDSNPDSLRNQILSLARLPISPPWLPLFSAFCIPTCPVANQDPLERTFRGYTAIGKFFVDEKEIPVSNYEPFRNHRTSRAVPQCHGDGQRRGGMVRIVRPENVRSTSTIFSSNLIGYISPEML